MIFLIAKPARAQLPVLDGYRVPPAAQLLEKAQNVQVAQRLGGVIYLERHVGEGVFQPLVLALHHLRIIDVERTAELLGELGGREFLLGKDFGHF